MPLLENFFTLLKNFALSNGFLWICTGISFVISASVIPLVIHLCRKHAWYDTVDERKIHRGNIPRLGSIGFVLGFFVGCTIFVIVEKDYFSIFTPFIFAGLVIYVFGMIDDFKDLNASLKLFAQMVASLIIVAGGYRFHNIFSFRLNEFFSIIFTFFWIVGVVNAYNLIDGMDGLCGGLASLTIFTYGIIFTQVQGYYSAICFILVAAVLGFLCWNKPRAKIFMGDGGSQFLGFMIAVLPLFKTTVNFEEKKFFIVLNLVSIPLLDIIAAMWRRIREHRGVMSPDKSHLHHKLMELGMSSVQVLIFLLSVQTVLCILTGISMGIKTSAAHFLLAAVFVFMLIFFVTIHYLHKFMIKK